MLAFYALLAFGIAHLKKNLDVFRSRAELNSQGPDNPRTGRKK